MAVTDEVFDFPNFPIDKQIFYVPGSASPGGYTSGGARIMTYEPGGFAFVDIQPAMQANEWLYPETSWLMSQGSGRVLRLRLAPTPQIATGISIIESGILWSGDFLWSNGMPWSGDLSLNFVGNTLKGSSTVRVNTATYGAIFRRGHLIGHEYSAYMINKVTAIDESNYDLSISPPLRKDIANGDTALNRPYFTGQIVNQNEIIDTYNSELMGLIQMPKITLSEVITP